MNHCFGLFTPPFPPCRYIDRPIALDTILEKINNGLYRDLSRLAEDVRLMFANAKVRSKSGAVRVAVVGWAWEAGIALPVSIGISLPPSQSERMPPSACYPDASSPLACCPDASPPLACCPDASPLGLQRARLAGVH